MLSWRSLEAHRGLARAPTSRLSRTVNSGKMQRPSSTWATPREDTQCVGRPRMLPSARRTSPPRCVRGPDTARVSVVLPASSAPTMAVNSPSSTDREMPAAPPRVRIRHGALGPHGVSWRRPQVGPDDRQLATHRRRLAARNRAAEGHHQHSLRDLQHRSHVVLDDQGRHPELLADRPEGRDPPADARTAHNPRYASRTRGSASSVRASSAIATAPLSST